MGDIPEEPGVTLDGARATSDVHDFGGTGPVPARRHPNGGGWVTDSTTVTESAFVGPDALVFGSARDSDSATVSDRAAHGNQA